MVVVELCAGPEDRGDGLGVQLRGPGGNRCAHGVQHRGCWRVGQGGKGPERQGEAAAVGLLRPVPEAPCDGLKDPVLPVAQLGVRPEYSRQLCTAKLVQSRPHDLRGHLQQGQRRIPHPGKRPEGHG